ncbi:MAG: nucleotidyltransferase [Acidobacteriaceae bacterium]
MATLTAEGLLGASRVDLLDDVLVHVCEILQLSPTQYSLAEKHYSAICEWLGADGSALNRFHPDLWPQGSVALGTTVRPRFGTEYDVDLVCELQINHTSVREPSQLLDLLELRMRENETYAQKLERKRRCLCVNYEHDFHLDILPAVPDPGSGDTCLFVPDGDERRLRRTNPKGFIRWFKTRSALKPASFSQKAMDAAAPLPRAEAVEDKSILQLSVQLIKRWRDKHYANEIARAPASILLTALMGNHYRGEQSVFINLAESVGSILASIPLTGRLIVPNPSHPAEDISERWEDESIYRAFVSGLRTLSLKLRAVEEAEDMGRRSELLRELFGENLVKTAFAEQVRKINEARDSQKIGVARVGGVVSLSDAAVAVPIRKNTFYGDRRQKKT